MLRPLSNQKKYDVFWSQDPDLIPLPGDATENQKAERARKIELALTAGPAHWAEITTQGGRLTAFTMRPLTSEQFGELLSMLMNDERPFTVWSLAFRLALVDCAPLPDGIKVDHASDAKYGTLATTKFLDETGVRGESGANLIVELGRLAFERAKDLSPKS